ncbi:hypothetical protein MLD38_005622 [Melastoma candidum]|uniref:Uncharacterized protein n=1 Tax=Melastoma candidum TaxID=119954 RepID=A0ACB9RK16_9MYRT|nr:hypothetical protein MLD38_005622 [Melastoma candidum]
MGRKKSEDTVSTTKVKAGSSKDAPKEVKREQLSVSAMLASMDQKPEKKKASTSSAKPRAAPKVSSYMDGIDLPPSDEEDEGYGSGEDQATQKQQQRSEAKPLEVGVGNKVLKKREKENMLAAVAAEHAKEEALKDGLDAFTVIIGSGLQFSMVKKAADLQNSASGDGAEDEDGAGDDAGERLAELYERLQILRSDAAEAQASKILAGLGFTKDMQGRPTKFFSGRWRMTISLARALFVQPTLLLLDEPTNHLDLRAVLWLEEYLCRWKKTLVVVSHDRDFLNTMCTEIIHLHDQKLHFYHGNFDDFESGYEQRRKEMNKKFEIYDKQVKATKRSGNKAQQEKVKDRAEFNAAKEASKNKKGKVDEDEPVQEAPKKWRDYSVEFHFPEPTELTPPLLQLIEVSFSYPNRPDFRLSNVDVGIDMGTRVAIVGPNGAGKSTLLNLLAGDLVPTEGEVRRSQKLRIGRYSQHFVGLLTMDETPVQYLLRLHPDQEGLSKQKAMRAKLGKFGLPSHNHLTPIQKLSGRQKARVLFTSISMSKAHILLLDEPTNHLDMQSIDTLADVLDEFTGGVVLVSHDSRLISRVCEDEERSQVWVVDNGTVITSVTTSQRN